MKHRGALRFAYAIYLIVACAELLEATVRLSDVAPAPKDQRNWIADPLIPYKLKPFSTRVKEPDPGARPVEYRHNSLGFRDEEHARQKAAGVVRIVAIGDSFTYGAGVDFAHSYLARLEQMLNADGRPPTEIIKLGIPRYFPAAERLVLDHYGWAYNPDLVLVGVICNDVIDTSLGLDAVVVDSSGFLILRQAQRLGKLGIWLFLHSHVVRMLLHHGLEAKSFDSPRADLARRWGVRVGMASHGGGSRRHGRVGASRCDERRRARDEDGRRRRRLPGVGDNHGIHGAVRGRYSRACRRHLRSTGRAPHPGRIHRCAALCGQCSNASTAAAGCGSARDGRWRWMAEGEL